MSNLSFKKWLLEYKRVDGVNYSDRTVEHYVGGFETINKEMFDKGIIHKSLYDMGPLEAEENIKKIFNDPHFIVKNTFGHNMYSASLNKYIEFLNYNDNLEKNECEETFEKEIFNDVNVVCRLSNLLAEELQKYVDFSVDSLIKLFNLNNDAKQINRLLFDKMIDSSEKKDLIHSLINKTNSLIKVVKINENGTIKESVSLPTFKYIDIYNELWDNSSIKNFFKITNFIFVGFIQRGDKVFYQKIRMWKASDKILNGEIKNCWVKVKDCITSGKIVKCINSKGQQETYFPSMSETEYVHVRPHASNYFDSYPLPIREKTLNSLEFTKHCFWINSKFISKMFNDEDLE